MCKEPVNVRTGRSLRLFFTASLLAALMGPLTSEAGVLTRASEAGAHLDSNLMRGGGTDDTAALQRVLDGAATGHPVQLVLDGAALVGGLNVYGNTTVECTAGGGLYLKDGASRAILRNVHRSRGAITDEHISVRGCFLNGNRKNQPSANIPRPDLPNFPYPSNKEKDGTYLSGLQFLGVNYLTIEGVTLWDIRAFGALIANASAVQIHDVIVDAGGGPGADYGEYIVTDGLHFKGPLRDVTVDSAKFRVGDDAIALSPNDYETDDLAARNDFGPYVGQGPITDVTISNIILMPGTLSGFRILSSKERIDRIAISNVVGVVRGWVLSATHWQNRQHTGNVGRITLNNINVDRLPVSENGLPASFIEINARIETLQLHGVTTRVTGPEPLIQLGPSAAVQTLQISLTAADPTLMGTILQVKENAHVDQLKFALNWQGTKLDEGKNPIDAQGGTIAQLDWVDTPPLYVRAQAVAGNAVDVVFNQSLDPRLSPAGATLIVNGRAAALSGAAVQPDGMTVRYRTAAKISAGDAVTWSYDERIGDLRNRNGACLHSVAQKPVINQP